MPHTKLPRMITPPSSHRSLLVATLLGISTLSAFAQTKTWTPSGGSTNLAGNTNWTPTNVPVAGETALFSSVSASTLTTGNNLSWGLLSWAAAANTTINISASPAANRELTLGGVGGQLINVTSGTLTISGTTNANGARLGVTLGASGAFNVDSGANLTISAPITGSSNITKTGVGTLLIFGTNTNFTGTTIVSAGLLGGTGGVRNLVVQNGGTLSPGGLSATGTFRSGNLTLDSGSTFALKLNTSTVQSSLLEATGNLSLTSGAILTLGDLGSNAALTLGTTFTVIDYSGTWNGGLFTYNSTELADDAIFAFGANNYQISYNGVDGLTSAVTLTTVIPEPSAGLLALAGCGAFAFIRRARRA
jgi:hypothetical protein